MVHRRRNRVLSVAVLVLNFWGIGRAWGAVTPGGDTTVAATSGQNTTVGKTAVGTLAIDGGSSLINSSGFIGYYAGSAGTATVSGAGSTWTNNSTLNIGLYGSGLLTIASGGQLTSSYAYLGREAGSVGTSTVTGPDSKWHCSGQLHVGNSGSGALRIGAGGQIDSYAQAYIGTNAGSTGAATVSGAGATWTNTSGIDVGKNGNGSLIIQAGGQVNSFSGVLGREPGSIGTTTVMGTGSTWTNSNVLRIGNFGGGTLTVSDGGLVTAKTLCTSFSDLYGNGTITASAGAVLDADIAFDASHGNTQTLAFGTGGTLNLTVDGGDLGAGYKGSGSLRIADGVALASTYGYLGYHTRSSGSGTVNGAGSAWVNAAGLHVGYYGNASLNIEAGGEVRNGTPVGSYGTYLGYYTGSVGTVTVSGVGSKLAEANELYVGNSGMGTLAIAAGGQVSSHRGRLGNNSGSTGAVTVSGAGSQWTNSTGLSVGYSGTGTLLIEAGGQVSSSYSLIGDYFGSTGTATVRGAGSKWTNDTGLTVGYYGSGTLSVEDGGQVTNGDGRLGYDSVGAHGTVTVRGAGSKWTNNGILYIGRLGTGKLSVMDGALVTAQTLLASPNDLLGNGTITVSAGAVLDADLVFDNSHGTTQALAFGSGGTLNLTVSGSGHLGAGYKGSGSLRIADGKAVTSTDGYLGYNTGSAGTATVSGPGSVWANSGTLYVGSSGSGTLTVADGGKVTARTLRISNTSAVHVRVSGNDMLILGNASSTGSVINNGTVSLYADAFLPAGLCRPVAAYPGRNITWSGSGSFKAFGGVWSSSAKTFTVAEPTALEAGATDVVSSSERLLFTNAANGQRVGAAFGTVSGSGSFSATPISDGKLSTLARRLDPEQRVLAAWEFASNLSGTDVLLSFDIGPWASDPSFWQMRNSVWSAFSPSLLSHDANGIVSFTVSEFSGYAIAAVQLPQWQGDDPATPAAWMTAANWTGQSAPGKGAVALFTQSGVNKSVDLGGEICTAGVVRLASSEGYNIANGTLAIDNDGKEGGGIRLEGGSNGIHVFSAAVRIEDDASITVDSGSLNLSGGMEIASGKTLSVAKAGDGALQISAITGGVGTLSLGAETVTKLNGDSSIGELVMDASARLDLGAELLVTSGSIEAINALVASGRAGGNWDGHGIMSSALAGDSGNRTLAVLAEGDRVKVVQTWAGDLTGDGVVDGADYLVLDRNWLADPGTLLYADGNIDYSADGITGDDFFQMDRAYMGQSMTSGSAGAPGSMAAAVPEPGMMGLVVLAGLMLGRRARGQ